MYGLGCWGGDPVAMVTMPSARHPAEMWVAVTQQRRAAARAAAKDRAAAAPAAKEGAKSRSPGRAGQLARGCRQRQPGKPREVCVGGDELAAVLDGQCRVVGVSDELAPGSGAHTKLREELPARGTVTQGTGASTAAELLDETDRASDVRQLVPDLGIGDDADEGTAA